MRPAAAAAAVILALTIFLAATAPAEAGRAPTLATPRPTRGPPPPSPAPSAQPSWAQTPMPTAWPTQRPRTHRPTRAPVRAPTATPTNAPGAPLGGACSLTTTPAAALCAPPGACSANGHCVDYTVCRPLCRKKKFTACRAQSPADPAAPGCSCRLLGLHCEPV